MPNESSGAGPGPAERPSGLPPEDRNNLVKAAVFVALAIALILGLKLLLGY